MKKFIKEMYAAIVIAFLCLIFSADYAQAVEHQPTETIVHQGQDGDIAWSISMDGCLTLTGDGDWKGDANEDVIVGEEDAILPEWLNYFEDIVSAEVDISGITNCAYMFWGLSNLETLDLSGLDTTEVTDMSNMFGKCTNLKQIDLSYFDTEKTVNMDEMFYYCSSITSLDLSSFNTPVLEEMRGMFFACESLQHIDLSSLDTSNVSNMSSLFSRCGELEEVDVSHFNTEKVKRLADIFYGCDGLQKLDLSSFDLSGLKNKENGYVYRVFSGFDRLYSLMEIQTPRNLPAWVEAGESWSDGDCRKLSFVNTNDKSWQGSDGKVYTEFPVEQSESITLTRTIIDHKKINSSEELVRSGKCKDLIWSVDTSGCLSIQGQGDYDKTDKDGRDEYPAWHALRKEITSCIVDVTDITDTSYMFADLPYLKEITFRVFDTSHTTDMSWMFYRCASLEKIDVTKFDTSKATNMGGMFAGCALLKEIDVSKFDTSQVTSMSYMFSGCLSLETIDVAGFDTRKVEAFDKMFYRCHRLEKIDLRAFRVENASGLGLNGIFEDCYSLKQLSLGNWNVSKVEILQNVFYCCHQLTNLDMSGWVPTNLSSGPYSVYNNFYGCVSLSQIRTPIGLSQDISLPDGVWTDEAGREYKSLPMNLEKSILLVNSAKPKCEWEEFPYAPPQNSAEPSESTQKPIATSKPSVPTLKPTITSKPSVSTSKPITTSKPSGGSGKTKNTSSDQSKKLVGKKIKDAQTSAWYQITSAGRKNEVEYIKNIYKNARMVIIPDRIIYQGVSYKVTSIRKNAYKNYKLIQRVIIGKNVAVIGKGAFQNCSKLSTLTIGKNVQKIGSKAFYKCKKLKSIRVDSKKLKLKNIGNKAFAAGYKSPKFKSAKGKKKKYSQIFLRRGLSRKTVFI